MKTFSLHVLFLLGLFCTTNNFLFAQADNSTIEDQIVVQLFDGIDAGQFVHKTRNKLHTPDLQLVKPVVPRLQLFLLEFDPEQTNAENLLYQIRRQGGVRAADFNFRAQLRTEPNDPLYDDQWDMDIINAPEVWEFTVGGVTVLGDTIVIANLESCDPNHDDVKENLWRNWNDLPDGIDNDNNGYIDDHLGINISNSTDVHEVEGDHGTSVSGIIAAKGNNGLGVTGVNWDTKLMMVSNDLSFTEIIESYEYILQMRKKYNETNGLEGAFIVATNASLGVPEKFPDENELFPIWCEMYNELGQEGVVSVCATENDNINIDLEGDMPSTCESEFLIAVTNTDINDELEGGYSTTYIDMAAPGKGSFTTERNNEYGSFGGTSAAAPHVAGGIGLLYSLPCQALATAARNNVESTARSMKNFIMEGVKKLDGLEDKVVSEGRLDLEESMKIIQEFCGGAQGPLSILSITPNPIFPGEATRLVFQTPDSGQYTIKLYDALGRLIYEDVVLPDNFSKSIFDIDTTNLMTGIYFVTIENANDITAERIMIH